MEIKIYNEARSKSWLYSNTSHAFSGVKNMNLMPLFSTFNLRLTNCFSPINYWLLGGPWGVSIIIIFLLQMTQLMHRKVKWLFEGHTKSSYSLPKSRSLGLRRINALSAPTGQNQGFPNTDRNLGSKGGGKRSTKHGNGFFFCTQQARLCLR